MAGVLPTFSQELKNITSGNIGWLLNDELKQIIIYLYIILLKAELEIIQETKPY